MKPFFFAPDSPRLTAMIRFALGLVLLYEGLVHWRYSVELYSTAGPAMPIFVRQIDDASAGISRNETHPRSTAPRIESIGALPIPRPAIAVLTHTTFVVAAFSVVLGWHTRTSLITAFLIAAWLGPLDLPVTFGKQSVIALHLLLLLAFSGCGAAWSVDFFLDCSRAIHCPLSILAPRRLMQILVCCVYMGAAITKLKTPSFAGGDLLEFSLLDDHWGSGWFGLWLTTKPHVSLLLSLATLFFELLFPFLVWVPRLRWPMLALAFAFHSAMACLLHVGIFPAIMFTALLSFVEERDLRVFKRSIDFISKLKNSDAAFSREAQPSAMIPAGEMSFNRAAGKHFEKAGSRGGVRPRRIPLFQQASLRNAAVHLAAAAILVGCGMFVQVHYDWYGVFGRRPAPALNEIDAEEVSEMLAERLPAYEDYFHRIELGSRFGGNQMFGASRKFKVGQRAYILAQLIQPHPVIELEGLLIAPDGREVARFTHRLDIGTGYAINGFELTHELPVGKYRIILQADGFVIAERQFDLEP